MNWFLIFILMFLTFTMMLSFINFYFFKLKTMKNFHKKKKMNFILKW